MFDFIKISNYKFNWGYKAQTEKCKQQCQKCTACQQCFIEIVATWNHINFQNRVYNSSCAYNGGGEASGKLRLSRRGSHGDEGRDTGKKKRNKDGIKKNKGRVKVLTF